MKFSDIRLRRIVTLVLLFLAPVFSLAQSNEIRLYLRCQSWCDFTFVKTEVNYVDFVNDRFEANVYCLLTSQSTGSGGELMTLSFIGQQNFNGLDDTLKFIKNDTDTPDLYRTKLVRTLNLGLMRYAARTNLAEHVIIKYPDSLMKVIAKPKTQEEDPWNYWVFRLGVNASLSANDISGNQRGNIGVSANRVTDKMKLSISGNASASHQRYDYDDQEILVSNNAYSINSTMVFSINDHMSAGSFISSDHNTFNNFRHAESIQPAFEYSFFPYRDAVKKSITLFYQVGPSYHSYIDTTVYFKTNDIVYSQSLALHAGVTKKWGYAYASLGWSNYLNDFVVTDKDRAINGFDVHSLNMSTYISMQLVKGLSVSFSANASLNKGLNPNIPEADYSLEDLLTNSRVYATNRGYNLGVGVSYRFGSEFNNVVNPRFGG
ncbi:MAG TPA: hypothetical protein PLP88_07670 [Bacteroidales bacterium]|nr:hypothetical protein [Bacteroidales bacterium]